MGVSLKIPLRINGEHIIAKASPDTTLLRFLRDKLGLVGTKDGCSTGDCGSCTVVVNGKATMSCQVRMAEVYDAEILTIEGLSKDRELHPIQQAFIDHGAVQCGFCIPGMIMTAKALLDRNPAPTFDEIKQALTQNRNLCRCTGYVQIISAIQDAAGRLNADPNSRARPPDRGEVFSNPVIVEDEIDRVSGRAIYADDIALEGMLHGKILWAEYPHAEILSIDTSEAENMPGVVAVITAKDIPGKNQVGLVVRDQPAIADKRVRYIGDSLAAVFAEAVGQAEEAMRRIKVVYRPLPGVFSPEEAAKQNAPLVHEDHPTGNLFHQASIIRGDVDKAFKQCAVVVEETYTTPHIEHGFLEPEAGIGIPLPNGGVRIDYPTQAVFDDRIQLSEILGLPEDVVRVVQLPQGGSFGGKEDIIFHQYLALGALKTQRSVKIVLTRAESLRVHVKRHPAKLWYKTGADGNGKILAIQSRIILDTGAYASLGYDVMENTLTFGAGAYYVPNLKLEAEAWYTNNVLCGAMRGFGTNQVMFALEQQIDMMARALNIDPFEFRLINALDVGLPSASDHVLEEGIVAIKQTIEAARQELAKTDIPERNGLKIGVGVACGVKNIGFGHNLPDDAGAIVELNANGKVLLRYTQHDYGQGPKVALIQLVADELGTPVKDIQLIGPDTDLTPQTGPTTASRQTFITGNAVIMACHALKDEVLHRAAEVLDREPSKLRLAGDRVIDDEREIEVPLADIGEKFVVEKRFHPPPTRGLLREASHFGEPDFESRMTFWCYTYSTQVAIVGVDINTGIVQVLKLISANDLGKVINPLVVKGQIFGGVMMGIGYALSEEYRIQEGVNLTDTFGKCRIPTAHATPEVLPVLVEVPHPFGPQGAKGFAEGPSVGTAPAISNAIFDAIGVRICDLPANQERVLVALATSE